MNMFFDNLDTANELVDKKQFILIDKFLFEEEYFIYMFILFGGTRIEFSQLFDMTYDKAYRLFNRVIDLYYIYEYMSKMFNEGIKEKLIKLESIDFINCLLCRMSFKNINTELNIKNAYTLYQKFYYKVLRLSDIDEQIKNFFALYKMLRKKRVIKNEFLVVGSIK